MALHTKGTIELSDAEIANAVPKDRPYKLYPGHGVYLIVQPNGSKLWRCNVRRNGINTSLSLGRFPETSFASAIAEQARIRTQARMGIHPGAARRAARDTVAMGSAGAAFALALSADGALSVTVGEQTLRLTRYQTDAIRAALLAERG